MHSPWHLKKKKMFSPTPHNARIQKGFIPYEKFTPPPPKYIYIYIYPDIHFREKRGGGKRGGRGWPVLTLVLGAFCIIIVLVTHNLIKADKHCSDHLFIIIIIYLFKKRVKFEDQSKEHKPGELSVSMYISVVEYIPPSTVRFTYQSISEASSPTTCQISSTSIALCLKLVGTFNGCACRKNWYRYFPWFRFKNASQSFNKAIGCRG